MEVSTYADKMSHVLSVSAKEALIHAKFYGLTGLSGNMIILSVLYYGGSLVTSEVPFSAGLLRQSYLTFHR
jgi:ATP-binding cassette subfamily B (MDR/TAP) protein 10